MGAGYVGLFLSSPGCTGRFGLAWEEWAAGPDGLDGFRVLLSDRTAHRSFYDGLFIFCLLVLFRLP